MLKFPKQLDKENIRGSFIGSNNPQNISASLLRMKGRNGIDKVFSYFSLLFLLHGEGVFIDEHGKEYKLKPGHFVLRRPDRRHSVIRDQGKNWIEFAVVLPAYIYEILVTIKILDPVQDVVDVGIDQSKLDKLCKFIEKLKSYTPKEFPLLVIEIQSLFYDLAIKDDGIDRNHYLHSKIEDACTILSEGLDKKIDIPACAKKMGMGYHNFRKGFKEIMGLSPKAYRIRKRIEFAQNIMREETMSLKEIAEKAGYPDFASFAKQYKKVTGTSPAQFKKGDYY